MQFFFLDEFTMQIKLVRLHDEMGFCIYTQLTSKLYKVNI
jgi:hypothetical protein